jgi:hypothetical protein
VHEFLEKGYEMYINPFVAGVIFTILVEVGLALVYSWSNGNGKDKR